MPARDMTLVKTLPAVRGDYFEGAPLANLIWFRTGGAAEVLFRPEDEADLQTFLKNLRGEVPVTIIGIGSNLLVRDGGVRGVVIKLGKPFGNITLENDLITAGAGATDVAVAHFAHDAALTGLEFLRGIPGTVGGALRMNAGAYGVEIRDVFHSARAVDRAGVVHTLRAGDMGFSYRKTQVPADWIFVSGSFRAAPGDKKIIKAKMDQIQAAREATQPMRVKTGGSTFKNPKGQNAWALIDAAGCRGLTVGGARVSDKHCNFLINTGAASASDLETLGEKVRRRVLEKQGISLQWEIERIGERVDAELSRRIRQTAFAILRKRPEVYVGTSLVLQNPLIRGERLVKRSIDEAHQAARLNVQRRHLRNKQELQRIILERKITTVFQPIWDLDAKKLHGFEALCRGPSNTEFRSPLFLFDVARKADLLFELDHLCRRRALEGATRLSRDYKLFINTFPFSIRDPRFQGQNLIDIFAGTDLAPEQIVLEVTESLAIDNIPLFVNAMKDFMDLRCLVAIDDMGAGYSGLDKIVHLRPNYVKLDMGLVRDIHTSFVKQQLVQTFKKLADKIDAKLIAEGIEHPKELEVVRKLGVNYIQGNLLAKPSQAFQTTSSYPL